MIPASREEHRRLFVGKAIKAEEKANRNTWISCAACYFVSGHYEEWAVQGLAEDLGKSTDTVYDRAHAYEIFVMVCNFGAEKKGKTYQPGPFRELAFLARRAPYITWSHFRALWDARKAYKLSDKQIVDLLIDIVQGEGGITSRGVDGHVKGRYGVERGWEYYTDRIASSIRSAMSDPNLPSEIHKDMKSLYSKISKF